MPRLVEIDSIGLNKIDKGVEKTPTVKAVHKTVSFCSVDKSTVPTSIKVTTKRALAIIGFREASESALSLLFN